jgi:Uma2 family endonuclease
MSLFQTLSAVEYPESDGQPMGETDLHRHWMVRIHELLAQRYRGQRVYVSCNLLVYFTEGTPHHYLVPDVFVVKDADPGLRRIYKVWEEGKAPHVVFEVTSRSTRREDEIDKPRTYAKMGVEELFLYDPTSEYLAPPLQGFRRQGADFVQLEPDATGMLISEQLDLTLRLVRGKLVLADRSTGEVVLTEAESKDAQLQAEQAAREEAEARAAAAEDELRKLRQQLENRSSQE